MVNGARRATSGDASTRRRLATSKILARGASAAASDRPARYRSLLSRRALSLTGGDCAALLSLTGRRPWRSASGRQRRLLLRPLARPLQRRVVSPLAPRRRRPLEEACLEVRPRPHLAHLGPLRRLAPRSPRAASSARLRLRLAACSAAPRRRPVGSSVRRPLPLRRDSGRRRAEGCSGRPRSPRAACSARRRRRPAASSAPHLRPRPAAYLARAPPARRPLARRRQQEASSGRNPRSARRRPRAASSAARRPRASEHRNNRGCPPAR